MSITAAAGTGLKLGDLGQKVIINYSKSVYDKKINELQSYISELEQHKSNLEGYQSKMRAVWEDASSEEYQKALTKQIKAVENATNRARSLKDIYTTASEALEQQKTTGSQVIEGINSTLDALGIGDD